VSMLDMWQSLASWINQYLEASLQLSHSDYLATLILGMQLAT